MIGQVVGGRHFVVRRIGKGGTGSIYEVQNIRLGRSFALKTLTGDAAVNAESLQRFRREAEIVAKLKHPNVVEIIDWDELPDGSPCIVMEYLKGEDLASRINTSSPLPWELIAQVGDRVLAALTVTHASGIVHRDLKPQNVFLALDDAGDEQVKLLDFGVSKFRDKSSLTTSDSRLVGTPAYMAPEQAKGQPALVGTHTDVWAMAIMLHEMATGVLAFDGDSVPSMLYAICHGEPVPIHAHRSDAPAAFVELIADALVRPIEKRLADAAVMRGRLRDALRPIPAVQVSRVFRATPPTGVDVRARGEDALALTAPAGATVPMQTPAPNDTIVATRVEPAPRRSSWLLYAILGGIVLGVGGIVYAVVRMQRREQPQAPEVAVVPVAAPADAASIVLADAAVAPAIDAEVQTHTDEPKPKRPPAHRDPDTTRTYIQNATKALSARTAQLLECFNTHEPSGGETIKATIVIGADGHAKQVSFAPDRIDGAPLGGCLRAEILRVQFPTGQGEQTFSIPLRATRR